MKSQDETLVPVDVIDSHQHFWRFDPTEHTWMTEAQGVLKRDYLPADLAPDLARAGVSGTVAVQARRLLKETEWLLELAAGEPFIRGVVGWFDFESRSLEADLERLAENPLLVGARELIHDMPDVDYATSSSHVNGVRAVGRAGLAYDLLLKPQHLQAALALADLLPEQRFVVDHLAKPTVATGQREPWARDLRALAERANVSCKLSGFVTEADWSDSRPAQFTPYFETVLGAFGPERVMFGSDWPVCLCAASYGTVNDIVAAAITSLSASEQAGVLGANAARFYRLPPARSTGTQPAKRRT